MSKITKHHELDVYKRAFAAAMEIYELSRDFPVDERYSLTDQIRRSSRSVCANLAEAWRKRRYEAAFISKINDCEAESAETQTWVEFAVKCGYIEPEKGRVLYQKYESILITLVGMINHSESWVLDSRRKTNT